MRIIESSKIHLGHLSPQQFFKVYFDSRGENISNNLSCRKVFAVEILPGRLSVKFVKKLICLRTFSRIIVFKTKPCILDIST